ncbi:hypothetical protein [Polaribacter sp. 11A2H]|uniref:hypothetical protein n=1 Tax=Polaribacter sp. 11A2H TaxID=2687290 RepID=UPI001407DFE3|nr:hypothetical protein [Polaribacter sp. 11A2H]
MKNKNITFLSIGILLIILSLFLFTRPAIFENLDFSNTGQIGDTIGGITAPIINLFGAFLVYISFQEQLKANEIQVKSLKEEKERNSYDRVFNNYISLYQSLKNHLDNLEFIVEPTPTYSRSGEITKPNHIIYKGLNALNEYVIRIEKPNFYSGQKFETYGIFLSFQFILKSLMELSDIVEINITNEKDKTFLNQNMRLMYESFLQKFAERIMKVYNEEEKYIKELKILKNNLDKKYSA